MKLDNFTIKAQESVQKAFEIAESKGQQSVESSHLLKGIMTVAESVTDFLFGKLGTNIPNLNRELDKIINSYAKVSGADSYMSLNLQDVL